MFKKTMIPILAFTLILLLTSVTFAKPLNTFSVNILPGGSCEICDHNCDFSQLSLGLTVPINSKLEFNGEISSGTVDTRPESDTTSYKLKGDFRIFEDRKVRLDFAGGFYQRNLDFADYTVNSLTVGLDARIKLNSKLYVYTGLGMGLVSNEKTYIEDGNPNSLYLFHLKFNYLINSRFGLALGYTSESIDSELINDHSYNGLSAGAFWRF